VLAAYVTFCVLVWLYGEAPRAMLVILARGTWGTSYGAGQVLFKATPLLATGLAVHVALRAGLFNIGAEGQLAVASLAVGAIGARLGGLPGVLAVPLLLIVAMAAGALWAAPPAILRARFGAHEVIGTIMMNRIADAAVGFGLSLGLAEPGSVRTRALAPGAHLPRLDRWISAFEGSAVSAAIIVVLAIAIATMTLLPRTLAGKEQELVGQNARACRAEHIPVERRIFEALIVSGAIAGLASAGTVLGYKGYFELGLGSGAGFGGLAVALLARGRLTGLVFAALLFATLQQGGLALNAYVPMEMMTVIQGVVIAALALTDARVRKVAS
jgi:simple sugar transport system permease protein